MRLKVELVASVSKDPERQDLNEDVYAQRDNRFALADGASESYDSKTWARLLAEAYTIDDAVGVQWVADRVLAYLKTSDFASLSWSKQAAFERGSFATLLGLGFVADSTDVDVLAIGDSLAVHVRYGAMLASFPFQRADEFDARPRLLSTLKTANEFVREAHFFTANSTTWPVLPGDQIFLVTDAIGHWLLAHETALTALASIDTVQEFERLVLGRRLDKTMRLDDSTVVRIAVVADEPESTA